MPQINYTGYWFACVRRANSKGKCGADEQNEFSLSGHDNPIIEPEFLKYICCDGMEWTAGVSANKTYEIKV